MIGLRLGVCVGISPVQRFEFAVSFARAISDAGFMRVMSPLSVRPVLHLYDLERVVRAIVAAPWQARRFDVFNTASFHSTISQFANQLSSLSRAPSFEVPRLQPAEHSFRVNCSRFEAAFSFKFAETMESTAKDLLLHADRLAAATYKRASDAINCTCVVCGGTDLESVLDLGHQPLANAFVSDPLLALQQQEHPLHLVSCPSCGHVQLSTTVDRSLLFKNYLYESGTSRTMLDYFQWLAAKVVAECGSPRGGLVVEIAHNDGSQLDAFKALGWETHGVDPAENLAAKARARGHVVHVAFWGVDAVPGLPVPARVHAIIAQNVRPPTPSLNAAFISRMIILRIQVLAHVENATQFLVACAAAMGPHTRLYIQTSQCEMFETVQFDNQLSGLISGLGTMSMCPSSPPIPSLPPPACRGWILSILK